LSLARRAAISVARLKSAVWMKTRVEGFHVQIVAQRVTAAGVRDVQ
jgi:hypothetical protein